MKDEMEKDIRKYRKWKEPKKGREEKKMKFGSKMLLGVVSVGAAVLALDEYARRNPVKVEKMKESVRDNGEKVKVKTEELTGCIKEKVELLKGKTEPAAMKIGGFLQEQKEKIKERRNEMDSFLCPCEDEKESDAMDEWEEEIREQMEDVMCVLEEHPEILQGATVVVVKQCACDDDDDTNCDEEQEENLEEESPSCNGKVKMPFTMKQWGEMDEETKQKIYLQVSKILKNK